MLGVVMYDADAHASSSNGIRKAWTFVNLFDMDSDPTGIHYMVVSVHGWLSKLWSLFGSLL